MTDNLIPFLREVVGRVMPFATRITHLHVKPTPDGKLFVMTSANDGSIHLRATSKGVIDFENARTCLSNLPYLNQILSSPFVKSDTTVKLGLRERNDKTMVSSMRFVPNARMEMNYMATDPFRSSIMKPGLLNIDHWPCGFIIDEHAFTELSELKKIHGAVPKDGEEPVVEVGYTGSDIAIQFGQAGGHMSTIDLDVEIFADSKRSISVYMLSDDFIRSLQQSQGIDKLVQVQLHPKALKMVSETSATQFELELTGRKVRQ